MVGRAVVHRNCWNWGSLLEWTAIEEEARGLWQSDLSGRKAVCYIAVIIYDKHFSVWDLPLNRNHRWCKLRGITSRHKTRQWGKLHGRLSQFWGLWHERAQLFVLHLLFFQGQWIWESCSWEWAAFTSQTLNRLRVSAHCGVWILLSSSAPRSVSYRPTHLEFMSISGLRRGAVTSTGLGKGAHSHGDPLGPSQPHRFPLAPTQGAHGLRPSSFKLQFCLALPSIYGSRTGLLFLLVSLKISMLAFSHRGLSLSLSQGKGLTWLSQLKYCSLPVSTSHPPSQTGQLWYLSGSLWEQGIPLSRAQSESTRK